MEVRTLTSSRTQLHHVGYLAPTLLERQTRRVRDDLAEVLLLAGRDETETTRVDERGKRSKRTCQEDEVMVSHHVQCVR